MNIVQRHIWMICSGWRSAEVDVDDSSLTEVLQWFSFSIHFTYFASHSATALLSAPWDWPGPPVGSSRFSLAYGCLGQWRLAWVNRLPQPTEGTTQSSKHAWTEHFTGLRRRGTQSTPFSEQTKGFSPVWRRWWVFSCPLWTKAFPQSG